MSYFTGIIPLVMLLGKIIARSQYHFIEIKSDQVAKIQSAARALHARQELRQLRATNTMESCIRGIQSRRAFTTLRAAAVTVEGNAS